MCGYYKLKFRINNDHIIIRMTIKNRIYRFNSIILYKIRAEIKGTSWLKLQNSMILWLIVKFLLNCCNSLE